MTATRLAPPEELARQSTIGSRANSERWDGILETTTLATLIALPLLFLSQLQGTWKFEVQLPFVVVMLWSAFRITSAIRLGRGSLHRTVFWLYVYIWLALAPLLQIYTSTFPLPLPIDDQGVQLAGLIVIAGLAAYEVGSTIGVTPPLRARRTPTSGGRLTVISAGSVVASASGVALAGGPSVLLDSRQALSESLYTQGAVDNSYGAIVSAVVTIPPFVSMIALLIARRRNPENVAAVQKALLYILVANNILVNNPVAQSRFLFVTVWGTTLLVLLWNQHIVFKVVPVLLVLGALFVFPFADVYRYSNPEEQRVSYRPPAQQLTEKGDFDSLEQIAWGTSVADNRGFGIGRQMSGAILFWVPRRYWEEKPRDTGIVLAEAANFPNTSVSAPLWIEMYLDGGFPLVLLAFLGVGMLHTRIASLLQASSPGFSAILVFDQLIILRGSLIATMAGTASILVMYLLLSKGTRK